ncbi:MFS transporter [Sneathiella sp. P13V-1]|uniref:MFS transporter n=1 Tax=Sneathiella sp. P13V-1 TaxID=2697366 RepID=UPI00187B820C|nr:MFS transporter [Sneathiella sp. P13V-1]MBE7635330.1 MFS transporter [Sneathiella sp. P13V-1]
MDYSKEKKITGIDRFLALSPVYYGWVVVAIVFVTMGIGVNVRTAFSLLYPAILEEFGWSRADTAATFTVGFICAGALSPVIGKLSDYISPRYLLSLTSLLVAGGLVLSTFSSEIWHIYVCLGIIVIGFGVAITYVGHSLFLPAWFERQRGLAIGVAFSGVGIGSVILMPLLQAQILETNWREACWFMAGLLVFIVFPLNFLFQRQAPGELGLSPDGDKNTPEGELRTSKQVDNIVDKEWVETDWTLKKAMKTPEFWWMSLSCCAALYVWYAIQVHQTKYLLEIGISNITASFALGLVGFAGIAGQIFLGHLSDRIGREKIWTVAVMGFAICYALLLVMEHLPSNILLYAMVIMQGGLGYATASVFGAMPADMFQCKRYGEIFGVFSMLSLIGGGIGPWFTGYLYDITGSYQAGFYVAIVVCMISVVAVWKASPRSKRLVAGQAEKRALMKS